MAEITTEAYQDLRDYIQTNWNYIALNNSGGTEILRLSPLDSRVSWVHVPSSAELQLQIIVKGSDTEIPLSTTIASSSIYKVASSGTAYSKESFNPFTFESENDELTVIHSIQVPQTV